MRERRESQRRRDNKNSDQFSFFPQKARTTVSILFS